MTLLLACPVLAAATCRAYLSAGSSLIRAATRYARG